MAEKKIAPKDPKAEKVEDKVDEGRAEDERTTNVVRLRKTMAKYR